MPFVYFFEKLSEFIVFKVMSTPQMNYQQLQKALKDICRQISKWPDPQPKLSTKVPVLQYQLEAQIPNYVPSKIKHVNLFTKKQHLHIDVGLRQSNKQYNIKNIMSHQQLLRSGPFQQINLNDIFITCQTALWTLWQGTMLNKSIIILGDNPQQVSHAVLGCISLISPFQYKGFINPYITVYDPNLDNLSKQKNNWLLGACNPLFHKYFKKEIISMIFLNKQFKSPKHLKPLKQFLQKCTSQQQRIINESAIRKYFSQLSSAVMEILNEFLNQQSNNLKFFNDQVFMKSLKQRKEYLGLEDCFSSKKYVYAFFEEFMTSKNFEYYLHEKNAVRAKKL